MVVQLFDEAKKRLLEVIHCKLYFSSTPTQFFFHIQRKVHRNNLAIQQLYLSQPIFGERNNSLLLGINFAGETIQVCISCKESFKSFDFFLKFSCTFHLESNNVTYTKWKCYLQGVLFCWETVLRADGMKSDEKPFFLDLFLE